MAELGMEEPPPGIHADLRLQKGLPDLERLIEVEH
jgi:hypothetical protein